MEDSQGKDELLVIFLIQSSQTLWSNLAQCLPKWNYQENENSFYPYIILGLHLYVKSKIDKCDIFSYLPFKWWFEAFKGCICINMMKIKKSSRWPIIPFPSMEKGYGAGATYHVDNTNFHGNPGVIVIEVVEEWNFSIMFKSIT